MGRLTADERFWVKVAAPTPEGCWIWTGGTKAAGYGHFSVKVDGRWGKTIAHRHAYELLVGPIPEGYELDHLCQVRPCVNPAHLEAVTLAENRRRRDHPIPFRLTRPPVPAPLVILPAPVVPAVKVPATHCRNGHEYAVVGWASNGRNRVCAGCRADATARKRKGGAHGTETHCPQGHLYEGDNLWTRTRPDGSTSRECRACQRARGERRR